jgi:hypothetical protein
VEKFLSELDETSQQAFGGKLMLLGGDWKQLLPVVRSTHGLGILDYTLKKSHLWNKFEVITLKMLYYLFEADFLFSDPQVDSKHASRRGF